MSENTENQAEQRGEIVTEKQLRSQFVEGNTEASKHSAGGAPDTHGHRYVNRFGGLMLSSAASAASRRSSSVSNSWLPSA